MATVKITKEGLAKYEEELAYLKNVRRKEVSQKIKEAREQGDLSENAEYDAAKDEQGHIEDRITEIEEILANAEVVENAKTSGKNAKVDFGSTVTVEDMEFNETIVFHIKGTNESDSLNNIISDQSPLGKALIGAGKGDVVEVEAPVGTLKYKVLEIKNK
ncbi:MAG: transcription elongation factor GreA [Lachnospiraceae bacterium]|nr:transcription elongation factor GreA [Lachnospiraceae bacterium]